MKGFFVCVFVLVGLFSSFDYIWQFILYYFASLFSSSSPASRMCPEL